MGVEMHPGAASRKPADLAKETTGPAAVSHPRGPYRTGLKRREQILDAATAAFARRGYTAASLREISREVGVTVAGLLRHFGSKEELLIAVLQRWDGDVNELHSDEPGLSWFSCLVDNMRYHEEQPGYIELYLTLCAEASDPNHPARPWIIARYQRIIDEGVVQLIAARDAHEIKWMSYTEMERELRGLYALMDGLELQWLTNPGMDLTATFQFMFATTLERWQGPRESGFVESRTVVALSDAYEFEDGEVEGR